jgi:hypothetical protein
MRRAQAKMSLALDFHEFTVICKTVFKNFQLHNRCVKGNNRSTSKRIEDFVLPFNMLLGLNELKYSIPITYRDPTVLYGLY